MSKLFVGSLPWSIDSDSLRTTFQPYGEVTDSFVVRDRETQRSRGFAFVTFATPEEAQAAIEGLDGQELEGRYIKVNLATERSSNTTRGDFGNRSGYRSNDREGGQGGYGRREGGGYGGRNSGYDNNNDGGNSGGWN